MCRAGTSRCVPASGSSRGAEILRCWDLAQEGRRVKTLSGVHDHFVTSLRWATSLTKGPAAVNGDGDSNGPYGMSTPKNAAADDARIRCAIATGSVP